MTLQDVPENVDTQTDQAATTKDSATTSETTSKEESASTTPQVKQDLSKISVQPEFIGEDVKTLNQSAIEEETEEGDEDGEDEESGNEI